MRRYQFTALDQEGAIQSGSIEAVDEKHAATILRERKYIITSLSKKQAIEIGQIFSRFHGVPDQIRVMFARQLATMIVSGLPLTRALNILQRQVGNQTMATAIGEIIRDIDAGMDFSSAIEKHKNIFSNIFISLVRAGEASGELDVVLKKLADKLESEYTFKSKTKGAMIYPFIILIVMSGVALILFVFVIPNLKAVYESADAELPFYTQLLLKFSDLITQKWWLLVLLSIPAFFGFRYFASTVRGKYYMADASFKIPIFGNISKGTQFASFSSTLALLIAAGLPILKSLDITRETLGNIRLRESVAKAAKDVERGSKLSGAIAKQETFPIMITKMIAVGEETGRLDETLTHVARFYEDETTRSVENLSSALEPIIMVVMGVGVAFMMLALIVPMYGLLDQF